MFARWDFETPEEYSDYMSKREALPKAAFQYGKYKAHLISMLPYAVSVRYRKYLCLLVL